MDARDTTEQLVRQTTVVLPCELLKPNSSSQGQNLALTAAGTVS